MSPGDLVVVSCGAPREKFWGVLEALDVAGVTLRAVALEAFDDWMRQFVTGAPVLLGSVTLFLPAHRLERVELDESSEGAEGLGDRFLRLTRRDPVEALRSRRCPQPSRGECPET